LSTRALTWVFYHTNVSASAKLVLLAIADNADDDGRNAWPSVNTLAVKSNMDTRTVQRVLKKLVELDLLTVDRAQGPRGVNVYHIHMPGWDVADLVPRQGQRVGASSAPGNAAEVSSTAPSLSGENDNGPAEPVDQTDASVDDVVDTSVDNPVYNAVDSVGQTVDNRAERAAERRGGDPPGVAVPAARGDISPQRGGTGATRTTYRTTGTTSRARARVTPAQEPPVDQQRFNGNRNEELDARRVLAELRPPWRLIPAEQESLVPLTIAALSRGWTVHALGARLSAGGAGVRSPFAVLKSRLRAIQDPDHRTRKPSTHGAARRAWCRDPTCDRVTRLRDPDPEGLLRPPPPLQRCPVCHGPADPAE
jgi:hypothetical protein